MTKRLRARILIVAAGVVIGQSLSAYPASAEPLSADEQAMIALMNPPDRARYLLQRQIQEKAELAARLSRLESLRHDAAKSLIDNIR